MTYFGSMTGVHKLGGALGMFSNLFFFSKKPSFLSFGSYRLNQKNKHLVTQNPFITQKSTVSSRRHPSFLAAAVLPLLPPPAEVTFPPLPLSLSPADAPRHLLPLPPPLAKAPPSVAEAPFRLFPCRTAGGSPLPHLPMPLPPAEAHGTFFPCRCR